jgi:hypothetical protein
MTSRGWLLVAGAATFASLVADVAWGDPAHALHWWNATPALDLGFGFAGTLVIVGAAKALGKLLLRNADEEGR